jgi:hypothetical protein
MFALVATYACFARPYYSSTFPICTILSHPSHSTHETKTLHEAQPIKRETKIADNRNAVKSIEYRSGLKIRIVISCNLDNFSMCRGNVEASAHCHGKAQCTCRACGLANCAVINRTNRNSLLSLQRQL